MVCLIILLTLWNLMSNISGEVYNSITVFQESYLLPILNQYVFPIKWRPVNVSPASYVITRCACWDGKTVLGGTTSGHLVAWDLVQLKLLKHYQAHKGDHTSRHSLLGCKISDFTLYYLIPGYILSPSIKNNPSVEAESQILYQQISRSYMRKRRRHRFLHEQA